MERFSRTGRQDEEFYQNGKYSQVMDFRYWSFYIAYKSVWTAEPAMFFPA